MAATTVYSLADDGTHKPWYVRDENAKTGTFILEACDNTKETARLWRTQLFKINRRGAIVPLDHYTSPDAFLPQDEAPIPTRTRRRTQKDVIVTPASAFPTVARLDSNDKAYVNRSFASLATSTCGTVVFLDAPTFCTTASLLDHGVSYDRLMCIQCDDSDFALMKQWSHVSQGFLRDALTTETNISALFADYCASWTGNSTICPREDIRIASRVVSDVVFVTLSTRGITKNDRPGLVREVETTMGHAWRRVFCSAYEAVICVGFQRT